MLGLDFHHFPSPENYTPVLKQYLEQRAKTNGAILLFRLGDFYESFFADAEVLAKELKITLTARADSAHPGGKVPMAGIPHKTADSYIVKLLKAGWKVAICEQIGEQTGKGPMQRQLVRILTPGTLTDTEYLGDENPNYLAAIYPSKKLWGLALVDISTSDLLLSEMPEDLLEEELQRLNPSEILVASSRVLNANRISSEELKLPLKLSSKQFNWTSRVEGLFDLNIAKNKIYKQFGEHSLSGFGCANYTVALQALGAILDYLEFTYPECAKALTKIRVYEHGSFLRLDEQTWKNLEVFETLRNRSRKGSLFGLIEEQLSNKMSARTLRSWLASPLLNCEQIKIRQKMIW